jgi:hypothetical protein
MYVSLLHHSRVCCEYSIVDVFYDLGRLVVVSSKKRSLFEIDFETADWWEMSPFATSPGRDWCQSRGR